MRFERNIDSAVRPIFRVIATLIAALFISFGGLALFDRLVIEDFVFDSTFRFGIAAVGFGAFFLFVAIYGRGPNFTSQLKKLLVKKKNNRLISPVAPPSSRK